MAAAVGRAVTTGALLKDDPPKPQLAALADVRFRADCVCLTPEQTFLVIPL